MPGWRHFLLVLPILFSCLIALRAQLPEPRVSGTFGGSAGGSIVLLVVIWEAWTTGQNLATGLGKRTAIEYCM